MRFVDNDVAFEFYRGIKKAWVDVRRNQLKRRKMAICCGIAAKTEEDFKELRQKALIDCQRLEAKHGAEDGDGETSQFHGQEYANSSTHGVANCVFGSWWINGAANCVFGSSVLGWNGEANEGLTDMVYFSLV
ncbi:hypothetical protein RIF29_25279 [Crotalaria pallida]|uniref:Uncharacterized protein n=1 Tax=Crotalaria pallida TaxID=3830 RepID=A0AAN9ENQ2_CROPI